MKTLYLTGNSANIAVDQETNEVCTVPAQDRYVFRSIYLMKEPMHVVYGMNDDKEEVDVKKGEFLAVLYNNADLEGVKKLVTFKAPGWAKAIQAINNADEVRKMQWAEANTHLNTESAGHSEEAES